MDDEIARQDFVLTIQDVFDIAGRGTIVVGTIESGVLRSGETVGVWAGDQLLVSMPATIDMIRNPGNPPRIGLLLGGVDKDILGVGQVVRRSGSP